MRTQTFHAGSPADKADLEVADEILEINGESLANSTHTDVIAHIHNVSWDWFYAILKALTRRFLMFYCSASSRGPSVYGSNEGRGINWVRLEISRFCHLRIRFDRDVSFQRRS